MKAEISILFVSIVGAFAQDFIWGPCTGELVVEKLQIRCEGLKNDNELFEVLNNLKKVVEHKIFSITVLDSVISYIPHNAFVGLKLTLLRFEDTSLMALTDSDTAFEGLEDSLEVLIASNCSFVNQWDWSVLQNLKELSHIVVNFGDLESVDDLSQMSSKKITQIALMRQKIKYIDDFAFSSWKFLRYLRMNNNKITEIKRSMLHSPAEHLLEIDLSYNNIENFPADMFTEMPKLEYLDIGHNGILYFYESVLAPVWSQLRWFKAAGLELICDTRMKWVLTIDKPQKIEAVCFQPPALTGKPIVELTKWDLWSLL